ncbi:hypothetical protein AYL99_11163 [Fonsecaea erecta]|uniref:Protein BFR2 n=1 Tax=Fonsecaea erecta TaxID=1367422 RepID=A0A178Z6N1_9EURO|nr:hypothetical protein AYL99_11163 [Fonsecaea erecta]OAP54715.1 hypothetical protein AYL99_11163 [Fonsecaea erecta]
MLSLREQAAELERKKVRDYDPEDDAYLHPSEDEKSENEGDRHDDFSRAHYETVGKSLLRLPEAPPLDAKYEGVAVSRMTFQDPEDFDALAFDEVEEKDYFAPRDVDVSGSEGVPEENDNLLGSDVDYDEDFERDKTLRHGLAKPFQGLAIQHSKVEAQKAVDGEDSQDEVKADESDLSTDHSLDASDAYTDEDDDDDASISSVASPAPPQDGKSSRSAEREELRRAAFDSVSTAALASVLSAGAAADVQKGRAVKQQRQTFDRLLDARIKLQKGITAMNELPRSFVDEEEVKAAAQQAEDAALALWSTIDSIRSAILSAREGPGSDDQIKEKKTPKRKRPLNPTGTTPLSEIWECYTSLEALAHTHRRSVIDKWHAKTQPVVDPAPRSKLLQPSRSSAASRLTDVLDTYLATESAKLIAQSYSPETQTYDDGPFYQALLRDLIASRSSSADADGAGGITSVLPTKLHVSGSKHKRVDTKASKGRKVRYTVHEKLENFMAPEDRTTWSGPARAEFFGSLLGRTGALDEQEKVRGDSEGTDGIDVDDDTGEGDALRLFRR